MSQNRCPNVFLLDDSENLTENNNVIAEMLKNYCVNVTKSLNIEILETYREYSGKVKRIFLKTILATDVNR